MGNHMEMSPLPQPVSFVPKWAFAICRFLLRKEINNPLTQGYVKQAQENYLIQSPEIRFAPFLMSTGWE